jgi:NAD(P)-dependent dehydrogenase (short-subunit alcohol dehydrogenase family)
VGNTAILGVPSYNLEGRVAIVTGGSSGIGRGIALRLAEAGATVVSADLQREPRSGSHFQTEVTTPTDELVTERFGVQSLYVDTDTSDPADVDALIGRTVEEYGRIDVLVNNAGVLVPGTSQEVSTADYERMIGVNLNGYFHTAKSAVPHLREADHGRIVNISSVNAYYGGGGAGYAASKAGIVNMTRDFAVELADAGVTANAVLPGVIKTPLQDTADADTIERRRAETPLPRLGTPRDVGNAVAFFASEAAEWITGAELVVDGGYVAGGH